MREIKFRAWDKERSEMYEVDALHFYRQLIEVDSETDHQTTSIEPFELMQYTGLKDVNGVDIYEGDILSTDLSRPYLVVEFRNGAFMYQCQDNGKDYYDIMMPIEVEHNQDKFAEVIGNIYENPELLGDSQ